MSTERYRLSLRQTLQLMGGDSRAMLTMLRELGEEVHITNPVPFHAEGFVLVSELERAKQLLLSPTRVTISHEEHTAYYHRYGTSMPERRNIISVSGEELSAERKQLLPKFSSPQLRACGHLDHVFERAREQLRALDTLSSTRRGAAFEARVKALVFELVFHMVFQAQPEPVDNTDNIMEAFQAQIMHSLMKVPRFVTRWRWNPRFDATSERLFERLSCPAPQQSELGELGRFLARLPPDKRLGYCVTVLDAGHDTTTMATIFALYYLARDPQLQERLREQLRPLCEQPSNALELARLPALNEVVHEALRLLPPLDRIPATVEGRDYNINVYGINTSEKVWPEPLEFRPQRFAEPGAKAKLLSFGGGSRRCLGANLGLISTVIFIAHILAQHRVSLDPGYELRLNKVFAILRPSAPIPFAFERLN